MPKEPPEGIPSALYAQIIAEVNQYTDRPDLLIDTIERHDPGFIRSMNEDAKAFSKKNRDSRFNFGRIQAYASLLIQVLAALFIFAVIGWLAYKNFLTPWLIFALAVFYAVTQSGLSSFKKIAEQISSIFHAGKNSR